MPVPASRASIVGKIASELASELSSDLPWQVIPVLILSLTRAWIYMYPSPFNDAGAVALQYKRAVYTRPKSLQSHLRPS